nr:DUF397 domain-containing protein [Actinomadura rifamycini]
MSKVTWRKAVRSKEDGSNCIEIAASLREIAIRDSKDPDGPKLVVSAEEFRSFSMALKDL